MQSHLRSSVIQPVRLLTGSVFLTYRLVSAESWRSGVTLPVCLSTGPVFLTYRSVSAESFEEQCNATCMLVNESCISDL